MKAARAEKPSHNEVINAIVDTVLEAAMRLKPDTTFYVNVSSLPAIARRAEAYDLERAEAKLMRQGIVTRSMVGATYDFYKS